MAASLSTAKLPRHTTLASRLSASTCSVSAKSCTPSPIGFFGSPVTRAATRTPPTGPENGSPAIWVDADAALIASTS